MEDNRVVIEYQSGVDRAPGRQQRFAGETYVVKDAAKAKQHHPDATILRYADGREFVGTQDESLQDAKAVKAKTAEREAEKEAKRSEREAEKASKVVARTRATVVRRTTPKPDETPEEPEPTTVTAPPEADVAVDGDTPGDVPVVEG